MPATRFWRNAIDLRRSQFVQSISAARSSQRQRIKTTKAERYIDNHTHSVRAYHQTVADPEPPFPDPQNSDQRNGITTEDSRESRFFQKGGKLRPRYLRSLEHRNLRELSVLGRYEEVQLLVQKAITGDEKKPDASVYDILLLSNTDPWHGSSSEVAKLLQDLIQHGYALDSLSLHHALKVLSIHPDYLLREHILDEIRRRWFSLNEDGWHDLIVGLLRERQIEMALEKFQDARDAGVEMQDWLYDIIIYNLSAIEEFDEILQLLQYRQSTGKMTISPTLWFHLLDCASQAMHHPLTSFVFNARVKNSYLNPSVGMCTNILATAARCGDVSLATSTFDILSRRSGNPIRSFHYETLTETYLVAGDLSAALSILTTMEKVGIHVSRASTQFLHSHLLEDPLRIKDAEMTLCKLTDEGRTIPVPLLNTILEAQLSSAPLGPAVEFHRKMQALAPSSKSDVSTYNVLLEGCAQHDSQETALELAEEMSALKVLPNARTFDVFNQLAIAKPSNDAVVG